MDRCPGPEVGPILFPRVRLWRRARLQGTPVFVIPKVPICPACRGRIKVEDIMGAPETRARLATVLAARARRPEPAWATAELGWIDPSAVA
jgi:hypothetical protein